MNNKKKKITSIVLLLVFLAVAITGGTLAYFTDTDSATNVMVVGSVAIEQHEEERDADGKLQPFTNYKPIVPAVGPIAWTDDTIAVGGGNQKVFTPDLKNVIDKFVYVENTGKSPAWVRTIVAIEAPEYDPNDLIHVNVNDTNGVTTTAWTPVDINGVQYVYSVFTYSNPLAPKAKTPVSLAQVFLDSATTNEDVAAYGDTWEILCLSQAIQSDGFETPDAGLNTEFGEPTVANVQAWLGDMKAPVLVSNVAELQNALNNADNGTVIVFGDNITGDVTATQKADVKVTIDGNGYEFNGVLVVDGKSARYATTGLTIENVKFNAEGISADACIRLGNGDNATRYTNNVTVKDCTFSGTGLAKVAIKSYTGGDWNLTIDGCTVDAGMHSLAQLTNVEKGLVITDCNVYSKNGVNLNNTPSFTMDNCEFKVKGYAVRVGVNGTVNTEAKNFTITNSDLESACEASDDAVIVFRDSATNATLTLTGTLLTNTGNAQPEILGKTADTVIN